MARTCEEVREKDFEKHEKRPKYSENAGSLWL
jgi:hypothetical protein